MAIWPPKGLHLTCPNMIFASFSLEAIDPASPSFALLKKLGFWPEIGFELGWTRFTTERFREKAAIIADHFPGASVHLPYGGLDFCLGDDFLEKKDRLLRAVELAELFSPKHLIAHPRFKSRSDSVLGTKKFSVFKRDNLKGPSQTPAPWWLDRSRDVWSAVLDSSQADLRLENTHEHSPEAIMILLRELGPRAAFCLDFGHWHHYAMGRHWNNLDFWLDEIGPQLAHAHVHDNNGEADQHLALGQGTIDYKRVRKLLAERDLRPTFTVENHRPEDLRISHEILAKNPLWLEPQGTLVRKVS
jgi:sugar phosphate isomerase/epimerase